MSEIAQFAKLAPYLVNPLVVIGFCLLLFFGVPEALAKAGVLAKLSPRQSSDILRRFLRYGFVVSVVSIVMGFAYGIYRFQSAKKENSRQDRMIQQTGACGSNIVGDNNKADVNCTDKTAGAKTK